MIKLPITKSLRFKLFLFTSLLIATLLSTTAFLDGSFLFRQLLLTKQEQAVTENRMMANQLASVLDGWVSQMLMVTNGVAISNKENYKNIVKAYTKSNTDLVGFFLIPEYSGKEIDMPVLDVLTDNLNDDRFVGNDPSVIHKKTLSLIKSYVKTIEPGDGDVRIINLSPTTRVPLIAVGMAFNVKGSKTRIWAFLSAWQTRLFSALTDNDSGHVTLLDRDMNVITSNSIKSLLKRKNTQYRRELLDLNKQKIEAGFKEWKIGRGKLRFGTWNNLNTYNLRLYTITSGDPVYNALKEIIKRSAFLALFVSMISILIVYVTANRTTRNLMTLMTGALEIAKGNFKSRINIQSKDEIGILGNVINYMTVELENLVQTKTEKAKLDSALETAKTVQNAYIPQTDSLPDYFKIGAYYQPAEACGGDWWGHFPISEDIHLFAIADATGHGIPAALVTAMIYSMVSLAAQSESKSIEDISPAELLSKFNKALCVHGTSRHTLTCFICVIDSSNGTMKYASAGHNSPLFYTAEETDDSSLNFTRKPLLCKGNPLGLIDSSDYSDHSQPLKFHDRIILFTDGLIECTNEKMIPWGKKGLVNLLKGSINSEAQTTTEQIVDSAFKHYNNFPLGDDITLVVINYLGSDSVESFKQTSKSA